MLFYEIQHKLNNKNYDKCKYEFKYLNVKISTSVSVGNSLPIFHFNILLHIRLNILNMDIPTPGSV